MSKILLNPEAGAPIQDIQILSKKYFTDKPWEVNTIKKFDNDKVADAFEELYEFLVPLSLDEAKTYIEDQKRHSYKCDKCDLKTTTQLALDKHLEKHAKEEALEKELGVESVDGDGEEMEVKKPEDIQSVLDSQARSEGLIGEGLVDETRPVAVRF